MHVFIDITKFGAIPIYTYDQMYNFSSDGSITLPQHYNELGHSFLALNGWNGQAINNASNISFGHLVNSATMNVSMSSILNNIQLGYIFIAFKQCPSGYPYY